MAEKVYAGKDLGMRAFSVTPEEIARHMEATGDRNPWYMGDSPFGGPVAPALMVHSESPRFEGWYLDNLVGNLYARQLWEIHGPMKPGQQLASRARVADRYSKRDREYVVCGVEVSDASGNLIAKGFHHQSFLAAQTGGKVLLADPAQKKAAQPVPEPAGEEIPHLKKRMDVARSNLFYDGAKNYHTDIEAAKELGFDEVVIAGPISACFISEMMTNRFGAGWYQGGRMDVKFINILWPDEPLTIRGVITGRTPEGAGVRANVSVWCEKDDGAKTIVGTASALE